MKTCVLQTDYDMLSLKSHDFRGRTVMFLRAKGWVVLPLTNLISELYKQLKSTSFNKKFCVVK